VVGDLFLAGLETSSTALSWIMLQLSQDLATQEKMQAELDRVLGLPGVASRLPSLADRPSYGCGYFAITHSSKGIVF